MPGEPTRKIERVNAAIKRDLGDLITTWLVDPRLSRLTTVSRVDTTRDLGRATVYIVIPGDEHERDETLAALASARVALRHVLKERMRIRHVPEIYFKYDNTIGETSDVLALLDEVVAEFPESAPESAKEKEPESAD
ncbi:MAG: 30S ribosome-binding factor RbfA [Chloroflexi bacterium]|nr:30S ribosome-binding factor RbfA [Chloroflexota bacterium]